jgi:glycerol-3-phosphate dehydrogenase (NAD+)
MIRFISISQEGAEALLETEPDGSYAARIDSVDFASALQLRHGMELTAASTLHDAEEKAGKEVDRRGISLVNAGEYNRRHHGVVRAAYSMVSAVAVGKVVLGDKEKPELTDHINEGYVVDLAEVAGNELTGADVSYEAKVVSSLTKTRSVGRGTRKYGGCPASAGHVFAFGNTEEALRVRILGCRKRGRAGGDPFDHSTGKGYVRAKKGDYYDALFVKGGTVIPLIVETFGGVTAHARRAIKLLVKRAEVKKRDGTVYGTSRTSTKDFYTHHLHRIGLAAVLGAVKGVRRAIRDRKMDLVNAGALASGMP